MLNLDIWTVTFQIINFLALAGLLYYFLFRPVTRNVKARAAEREELAHKIAKNREEIARSRAELEARLANAEEEAGVIIARAVEQADSERKALLQEAQAEVERILVEAHADAHRLRSQAMDEFHEELLRTVLDVSSLVIGRVAPEELHATMVQQLCDSVWEMGRSDMRRVEVLRRSLGDRTPTVVVRTAQPLSAEQQGLVVRTFSALADRSVNIDLKVESSLGLGVQVRLGDIVMDNTIAGRLDELRDSVIEALDERIADE